MQNIKLDTIVRTIVTLLAAINQLAVTLGWWDYVIEESTVFDIVSTIVFISTAAWSWWKNNSITKNAQKADVYLRELKNCE